MTRRFRVFLDSFLRDRAGGVFVYAAVHAPVLLGATALSVDIGLWQANKRWARSAADFVVPPVFQFASARVPPRLGLMPSS